MPSIDTLRHDIVTEYYDNSVLLNVMMNIEKFLCEELMIYPYKGWENGEVVAGPFMRKYHISVILRYDYEDMPDPDVLKIFKRQGIVCTYKKLYETIGDKKEPVWYVKLEIPRELVSDERQQEHLKTISHLLDIENIEDMSSDEDTDQMGMKDSEFGMDSDIGDGDTLGGIYMGTNDDMGSEE